MSKLSKKKIEYPPYGGNDAVSASIHEAMTGKKKLTDPAYLTALGTLISGVSKAECDKIITRAQARAYQGGAK